MTLSRLILVARRYDIASAALAQCLSVCLSVSLCRNFTSLCHDAVSSPIADKYTDDV